MEATTPTTLPPIITDAIALANSTSIGGQPAILANIALANQIFQISLAQDALLLQQRAMGLIVTAATARCVNLITTATEAGDDGTKRVREALDSLKLVFEEMKHANQELVENLQKRSQELTKETKTNAPAPGSKPSAA
jgi:hypothetical protein